MARIALILILIAGITNTLFAQNNTPDELEKLGQSAEKFKQYEQAAKYFMQAGDAYKAEADQAIASHTLTDLTIYNLMVSSTNAYKKAMENYKKATGKFKEQLEAQTAAMTMAARANNWAKEKKLDTVPKIDPPKPPVTPEAKQIPWKPGKEMILATTKIHFAMTMPDALKYTGPITQSRATNQTLRNNESTVFVVGINTDPRMQFLLTEYANDVSKDPNSIRDNCEKDAGELAAYNKDMATNPYNKIMPKDKAIRMVGIGDNTKACLTTQVTQQMDTKKFMFGFTMLYEYKGNSYSLAGIAPLEWRTCMEEMLKTFHITGQQPEVENDLSCFGKDFLDLPGLAFEDVWRVPDPKGELILSFTPSLPRDEVPTAWHDIINITREGVKYTATLLPLLDRKPKPGGKQLFILKFVLNYFNIPQITPGKLADAYMDVFDKMISAISGLEGQLSGMSVDFSYEIPYISVKTKCTPRFKCVNEKWTPDYTDMTFEIISEERGGVEKGNFPFLSPGQLKDKEAQIRKIPELWKMNAEKIAGGECGQHRYKLMDLKWPPNPKQCDRLEKKIALYREQLKKYSDEKAALAKELKDYGNSKFKNIDDTKAAIAKNNAQLKIEQTKLAAAEAKKAGYIANQANMETALFDKLMKAVNEEIAKLQPIIRDLNLEKAELTDRLQMLQSDKFEQINYKRTQFVEGEIARLNNEIDAANKQLATCREKEKLFKKN